MLAVRHAKQDPTDEEQDPTNRLPVGSGAGLGLELALGLGDYIPLVLYTHADKNLTLYYIIPTLLSLPGQFLV